MSDGGVSAVAGWRNDWTVSLTLRGTLRRCALGWRRSSALRCSSAAEPILIVFMNAVNVRFYDLQFQWPYLLGIFFEIWDPSLFCKQFGFPKWCSLWLLLSFRFSLLNCFITLMFMRPLCRAMGLIFTAGSWAHEESS